MRNKPLGHAMFDVNASMRSQHIHRTHPLHNTSDVIMNHNFTRGGLPVSTYSDLLVKHGLPLNTYVGTPDERLLVAMMYPMPNTTQTGVVPSEVQFGSQTSFNSHSTIPTQTNGRRHTIGSSNSPSSPLVKQSQMMPYFVAPVGGGYPFYSTLPTTGSRTMGENAMKTTHQLHRVSPVKRSRSEPTAGNQLWNDLEHAERLHKSLRVGRITPPPSYVPSNKNAYRNRRVQPILEDGVVTSEKKDVRQRQTDYVPTKGRDLDALKERHPPKRKQVNPCKLETHSKFVSTQSPLARPKVTMTTSVMPPNISTSTSPPMHPLIHVNAPQVADKEARVAPPRKKERKLPYKSRSFGYSPQNEFVRVGSNPSLFKEDKHVIQFTYALPNIKTKSGAMNNTMGQVHPAMHPWSVMQPYPNNGRILYHALTFSEGSGGQPELNRGSRLQPYYQKDGLHRADYKPLQSHHDKVRQKLRYELQCKMRANRPQRPNDVVTRHSASIPVTFHPSMSVEDTQARNNNQSSNVVNPHFISRKQDGECTPNKGPHTLQTGNMARIKLQRTNSSSVSTNSFTSKRVDPSKDIPMINEYQTLKKETNTGDRKGANMSPVECDFKRCWQNAKHEIHGNYQLKKVNSVTDQQKLIRERDENINRRKGLEDDADVRQQRNTMSTINQVVGSNGYVNQITYGEFLQDIVVPMTLAVSNKDEKNQEKITSLLNLWQNKPNHFQPESRTVNKNVRRKVTRQRINRTNVPNKPSNVSHISNGSTNVAKVENMGKILLIEEARKTKGHSKGGSVHEEETKRMTKDVEDHENPTDVKERTISKWDEQITSTTSDILTNNTSDITEENFPLKEKHPTEEPDEVSSCTWATPRMKSVRVVLRTSDRIRMKFYNVGSSHPDKPKEGETKRRRKRKFKRRKDMKKKRILMRIGSEKIFTRSLYLSNISPKKSAPQRRKKKAKKKTRKLPRPPKDFKRIALSVHKYAGETIIHRVVRVNAKDVLLYCLENNVGDINAKDNAGYTPLHECCVFDKVWMAEKLILHGADVNASANDGTRPIHDAVENHRAEMTRLLLSHGADPLLPTYSKRTALDNATSLEITSLLHDYLRDMNGEREELLSKLKLSNFNRRTIRLKSSFATQESKQWTDNFLDTSELDETMTEEQHDAIMYLKEIPQPKHFRLQLKENETVKTWYLLSDVLARLKIPAATFPYLYPHIKVNGLPTRMFLKKIERVAGLNQFDFIAICGKRELVEFVEADDEMCSILQFEDWVF